MRVGGGQHGCVRDALFGGVRSASTPNGAHPTHGGARDATLEELLPMHETQAAAHRFLQGWSR